MNPYDFVRIDWTRPPHRAPYAPHDRFSGWTGSIDCVLHTESPLFIPRPRSSSTMANANTPSPFMTNGVGTPVVPGSSLKGMLRGLVETLAPGCWWLFAKDGYRDRQAGMICLSLPTAFHQCSNDQLLCPACRMFGLIYRGDAVLLGKVGVDDAVAEDVKPHRAVLTPILDGPKPRHTAWYADDQGRPAGRKYYFHQGAIQTEQGPRKTRSDQMLNNHIAPVDRESTFTFRVRFTNTEDDELALLVYALTLEPAMRHKIGFAKPAGLGSVHIAIRGLQRQHMAERYRGNAAEHLSGAALDAFIAACADRLTPTISPVTLDDLRRIWRWPPQGTHRYPGQDWFRDNPRDPISTTP